MPFDSGVKSKIKSMSYSQADSYASAFKSYTANMKDADAFLTCPAADVYGVTVRVGSSEVTFYHEPTKTVAQVIAFLMSI